MSDPASHQRDPFVDFVRAFALVVVVVWHWTFTILHVGVDDDQIHTSSVLEFNYDLWPLTWVFQVMPLFFFVGGYAHLRTWESHRRKGGGYGSFVWARVVRLAVPSLALIAGWTVLGILAIVWTDQRELILSAVIIILSPLWFIAVYLVLVVIAPPMIWLEQRFAPLPLVVLIGLGFVDDVLRFSNGAEWAALTNLVVVWAACHQLGFSYGSLVRAPRSWAWSFVVGGLLALYGLISTGLYPASMVGVVGDEISNMSPPTMAIIAVCALQVGIALLIRPWLLVRLERPGRWSRFNALVNRFSMPLFLFHSTGMALALVLLDGLFDWTPPELTDAEWWLSRPVVVGLAFAITLPIILVFGKRWSGGPSSPSPTATPA